MTELEIPERAITAACEAYDAALAGVDDEHAEIHAVRVAAPIIVATELRRLYTESPRADGIGRRFLLERADELDPQ